MQIEYSPKAPEPVQEENILLNGVVIGWVKVWFDSLGSRKIHAGINVPVNDMFPFLIQGHGETKEEAVQDAMTTGAKLAENLANGIAVLYAELRGDK